MNDDSASQNITKRASSSAIAIEKVADNQYHIGIIYRTIEKPQAMYEFLHLAHHNKLQSNPLNLSKKLIIHSKLSPIIANQVSVLCRRVWQKNNITQIPYAFSKPTDIFGASTGELKLSQSKIGLTCATFVLAVYHAKQVPLVVFETWQLREEDEDFQRMWVERWLPGSGASKEHIEAVRQEIPTIRVRPEEVAGSATEAPPPVVFDRAVELSQQIIQKLKDLNRSNST